MTTTETEAPADESAEQPPASPPSGGPPAEPPELEAGGWSSPRYEPLWTRAILPLALPILACITMAVWVINLSRAFLAGGKTGAVVTVMVVTVTIMIGAGLMSAATRMRTSSKLLLVWGMILLIMAAGLVSLGPSEEHEAEPTGFQQPKGKPDATLDVVGGPGTKFNETEYTTGAGIVEIVFTGKESHTLLFDDPEFAGFILAIPPRETGKVELKPGEYTIYCNVPGHRAAGMEATVTVQ